MAFLRKRGPSYQLQYYVDGRRHFKNFPPNTPKSVVLGEKKRIEGELALHKAGIKRFKENDQRFDTITLQELGEKIIEARKNEVSEETSRRNLYAMQLFMDVLGPEMVIAEINTFHIDQFKNARYEFALNEYRRKKWELNLDKIKRGVNKELVNLSALFRAATRKGMIPYDMIPKFEKYKTDRTRLPSILN